MRKHKSLVIFLPSLAGGGAERVHLMLAPFFMQAGFDVTFLLNRVEGVLLPLVPQGVRVISLECHRTFAAFFPLVDFLRRERPDIFISNMGHGNILALWTAAIARVNTKIIVSQHNTLSMECSAQRNWQYTILPWLYRLFLKRAHAIIAVSHGVAADLKKSAGIGREYISVITNPVIADDFDRKINESADHPWLKENTPVILGVGRLVPQKDFATLIEAVACVEKVRLILLGEGTQRAELVALAESLGIADRVSFRGFVANPYPFMRKVSMLVVSSRYEGFGNVLVEALACGTPVVSTDCPHGPAEILEQEKFGILVPVGDKVKMAKAIVTTLDNPPLSSDLRLHGRAFTVEKAANLYLGLFETIL